MIIDQEKAPVVRFIFEEYLEDKGTWLIAKSLNEQQIPTKTGKSNWIPVTIHKILKNLVYTGDFLLQKTYSEDTVPFRRRKNQGEYRQVLIENDHEAIVTHEEYALVQTMMAQKVHCSNRKKEQREQTEESEFKTKVVCGLCGSNFNRQVKPDRTGKVNTTWSCSRRIKTKELCENDMIKESELEKAFVTVRNKLSSNCDEILIPLMKELEDLQTTPMVKEKVDTLEKQIQEQNRQRDILNRLAQEGHIDSAFIWNSKIS